MGGETETAPSRRASRRQGTLTGQAGRSWSAPAPFALSPRRRGEQRGHGELGARGPGPECPAATTSHNV
eukprot:5261108-Pyramimonas_sp.AAC.1